MADFVTDEKFAKMDLLRLDESNRNRRSSTPKNPQRRSNNNQQNSKANMTIFNIIFTQLIISYISVLLSDPPQANGANAVNPVYMQCSICLENMSSGHISSTPCGHMFCTGCITRAVHGKRYCPLCKKAVTLSSLRRLYLPT